MASRVPDTSTSIRRKFLTFALPISAIRVYRALPLRLLWSETEPFVDKLFDFLSKHPKFKRTKDDKDKEKRRDKSDKDAKRKRHGDEKERVRGLGEPCPTHPHPGPAGEPGTSPVSCATQ